jgi:protoporphyrinogen/coproporphyrinogen III oxidase
MSQAPPSGPLPGSARDPGVSPPYDADILVIGGGIAGLAAAYEVVRRGKRPLVLEAGPRPGGVILTERVDDFTIDAGPDSLLAQKAGAVELCRELHLGDRLQTTLEPRKAYVLRAGRLHPLPEASVMGIPTRFLPLVTTGLFSPVGKARMALDLLLPRSRRNGDESIAAFMRRRFGEEAVRYLAQPLLAGIHSGDVERLSMRALFPRLVDAEARYRSLILAFRAMKAGPSKDGIFRSLPGGIGELLDTVVAALPAGTVRTGAKVRALARHEAGHYEARLGDGAGVSAPRVIVAAPAYAAAEFLASLDPALAARCAEVPYASSVTVALAYRREQIAHPLEGSGFVVPASERQVRLMAGSFVSSKWPGRAPEGYALLRAFIGGARNPELLARDDEDLVALAHEDFAALLGITGTPHFTRLYRWERANAQHEVGHLARLAEIERRLEAWPGLFLTGSAYRGTGITDCVADGRRVGAEAAAESPAPASRPPQEGDQCGSSC